MIATLTTRLSALFLVAILAIGLVGCADSQKKAVNDMLSTMDEATKILEKVADGSLSSADASAKFEKMEEKYKSIQTRLEKFKDEKMSKQDEKELEEKMKKIMGDMMAAMVKVQASGRGTKELVNAFGKMMGKDL